MTQSTTISSAADPVQEPSQQTPVYPEKISLRLLKNTSLSQSDSSLRPMELQDRLLFAIPKKGRLHEQVLQLLAGSDIKFVRKNRLDVAASTNLPLTLVFLPAADIAKYVADGNVDLGITGLDMVEETSSKVEIIQHLGFGKCKLCVQAPISKKITDPSSLIGSRVVTSFTKLATNYFLNLEFEQEKSLAASEGREFNPDNYKMKTIINYVSGSVEAACSLGLADAIVDLVETGETMRAAGLEVVSSIMSTEAALILNPHSTHPQLVSKITSRIRGVIAANRYVLCTYNIPRERLPEAIAITPGQRSATVSPLENSNWLAVSSMILKNETGEIMDRLQDVGAEDILIVGITNCRV